MQLCAVLHVFDFSRTKRWLGVQVVSYKASAAACEIAEEE